MEEFSVDFFWETLFLRLRIFCSIKTSKESLLLEIFCFWH